MATPEWFSRLKRRTAEIIDFENDALERDMVRSQETPSEAQETEEDIARRLRVERERPEEEEIAPEDVKIFGMPRHVFHWTAIGAAGGYILAGVVGIIGEQLPGSLFETISGKTNATVWAVVVGAIGYFFSSRAYKKRKAAEESKKNTEQL